MSFDFDRTRWDEAKLEGAALFHRTLTRVDAAFFHEIYSFKVLLHSEVDPEQC